ncbi:MAG: hypothetical protein VXZ40_04045 [Nanoarchaeota archaeon]|nr:hypothetical protein [Nanoarchaeota archaeon]
MMSLEDKIDMGIFGKFFKHGKGIAAATAIASSVAAAPAVAENSATYSPTSSSSYTQQQNEWDHQLPGFSSDISLDKGLGIVYDKVKNNSISDIDAFNILAGRTRFLKLDKNIGIGDLLPSMKCDGGYAFLTAYLAKERNIRNPAMNIDFEQLERESPSMGSLIIGFDQFLKNKSYERSESYFLESIFINAYQSIPFAKQKVGEYINNPNSREQIIAEVNNIFSNLKFDKNEFEQCIPTSDSNRLMLAQWGAWGLTNLLDEQGRYNDSSNIFSIEKLLQIESKKLRVKKGEDNFYVKNDNRIRY